MGAGNQFWVADKLQSALISAFDADSCQPVRHFHRPFTASATGFSQTVDDDGVGCVEAEADDMHGFIGKCD